jgi:hypothetical protein
VTWMNVRAHKKLLHWYWFGAVIASGLGYFEVNSVAFQLYPVGMNENGRLRAGVIGLTKNGRWREGEFVLTKNGRWKKGEFVLTKSGRWRAGGV